MVGFGGDAQQEGEGAAMTQSIGATSKSGYENCLEKGRGTEGEREEGRGKDRKRERGAKCYKDIIMNGYERGVSEQVRDGERPSELWERQSE